MNNLKPFLFVMLIALLTTPGYAQFPATSTSHLAAEYETNALYLQLAPETHWGAAELISAADERLSALPEMQQLLSSGTVQTIRQEFPVLAKKHDELARIYRVEFADPNEREAILNILERQSFITFAEKVPVYRTSIVPNDPAYSDPQKNWHLLQIQAAQAWDITQGCAGMKIAIVDDAVRTSHEDLAAKIFVNAGEIPGNGIDDDLNGYIDDVSGYDVADGDGNVNPPASSVSATFFTHGTHVAGIAAGNTNNGTGMASIGFNTRILPVKVKSDNETVPGLLNSPMQGVEYAIASGADVINISWGSYSHSQAHQLLFNTAYSYGQIVVAAAGNDGVNLLMYPAAYQHVIAVAASDATNDGASFTNATTEVDVFAPGTSIWSSLADADNSYGFFSGTSLSTPIVSGLAALMMCHDPNFTPDGIRQCITNSADPYPSVRWPGTNIPILNAAAAVGCAIPFLNDCSTAGCEMIPNGGFEEPSNSSIVNYGTFSWSGIADGHVCGWSSYLGTADAFPTPVAQFNNFAGLYFSYSTYPNQPQYKEGIVTPELGLVAGQLYRLEFDAAMVGYDQPLPIDSFGVELMSNTYFYDSNASPPDTFTTQFLAAVHPFPLDTMLNFSDQLLVMDGDIDIPHFFHHYTIEFTMPSVTDMDRLVFLPYRTTDPGYTHHIFIDNVSMRPVLEITAAADQDTVYQGACVELTATGTGTDFVWEPASLFTDPVGATQQSCPLTSTYYIATTYDPTTGCSASDTVYVVVPPGTSVGLTELNETFLTFYPNPTNDWLHIELQGIESGELSILDANGKALLTVALKQDLQIPVAHLAPGVYYLNVKSGDHTVTERFVRSN